MPFQPINFLNAQIQEPSRVFPEDLGQKISQAYNLYKMPEKFEQDSQTAKIANAFKQMESKYKEAQIESLKNKQNLPFGGNQLRGAAGEAQDLYNLEQFYGPDHPVVKNAKEKWAAGLERGQFGTAALREQNNFNKLFEASNKNLTPEQLSEAKDLIMIGENSLPDGTPINLSKEAENSLNRLFKYNTTSAVLNRNIFGQQAESEIDIISDAINKGLSPYGDRFAGYSYKEIVDSFNPKDPEAQKKLGRAAGALMLDYELGQLRQMLVQGKTTVEATKEMRALSENNFKRLWPFKTEIARKEAMDYVNNNLKKAFEARKSVSTGAYKASMPFKVGDKVTAGAEEAQKPEATRRKFSAITGKEMKQ